MAETEATQSGKIKIGVCVMEKKVKCGSEVFSAPMEQILDRLQAFGEFEIILFGDKVILESPIEDWPVCDCLIAFHSSGYPIQKAVAYAALQKPFLVNELEPQYLLHDRRMVYERLEEFGVPVPNYALVNREFPYQELDYFVELEDFVEVHGKHFWKPFVEKPIDGDDHSIMIYYPNSAGGGMKELFRKVCGFDLLRCAGRSYVCDVNGWSFVKNSHKYYDDAACVLRKIFLAAKAPHLSSTIPPNLPWKVNEPSQPSEGVTHHGSGIIGRFGQSEELQCVIAVIRHGDRTPKQKVKLKVTEEKLLNLMLKYNGGRPRVETKLKSAVQLQDLLDATRILVPRTRRKVLS